MMPENRKNQDSNLNDLYQEVILEHFKRPRYKQKINDCCYCMDGKNPSCGDSLMLYCQYNLTEKKMSFYFDGQGCSISQASSSILCDMNHNVSFQEALLSIAKAKSYYLGTKKTSREDIEEDIEALSGVSQFPVRVKCAALPWKTLEILLEENFTKTGEPRRGCDKNNYCAEKNTKKLRVVTTEDDS